MTDEPSQKHTPGPWIVFDCDEELEVIPAGRSGGIALITSQKNRDANSHLVAAAPEMLEALHKALQFITNGIEFGFIRMPDRDTPDPAHHTVNIIGATIAKAEGRK